MFQTTTTAPFGDTPRSKRADEPLALLRASKEIGCFGRVTPRGVNLYPKPDTRSDTLGLLPYNTRLFVSRELTGDWYFVTLDDGRFGYVYTKLVELNPPEPRAYLYVIPENFGAQRIVRDEYVRRHPGKKLIQWGLDERHYVNALVHANHGRRGINGVYPNTKTVAGARIWIPSLEFAQGLKGNIPSGSISYELWQQARSAAYATGQFLMGSAAFEAGLIHGALESIWDLLTGIIDLVQLAWDVVKSLFSGEFLSGLKNLWASVESMNVSALLKAGLKVFLGRWNNQDFLKRWHFRGWLFGYALAEIVMTFFSGGTTLAKWAGKAGKLRTLLMSMPKVMKFAERTQGLAKSFSKGDGRLKNILRRYSDEAATSAKAETKTGQELNKAAGKGNSARHIEEPPFKGKLNGKPVDLPGVKVRKILYKKRERLVYEQLRKIFNATIRKSFVKSLANSPEKISHLRKAGLTDIDIAKLKNGKIPAGYQVHHKLPLDDGGTNEFENLVLIKNDPYHKAITNTQNALVGDLRPGGSKLIDFPVIEGFVYPPGH